MGSQEDIVVLGLSWFSSLTHESHLGLCCQPCIAFRWTRRRIVGGKWNECVMGIMTAWLSKAESEEALIRLQLQVDFIIYLQKNGIGVWWNIAI